MKHLKAALVAISTSIVATTAQAEPTKVIDLPDGMMFPEAIVEDGNGSLYVSVFGSGTLLRINEAGQSEVIKSPGEDGMAAPVGVAVDASRNRLWVSSINPETFMSKLHLFELESGALVASVDALAEKGPHFFNEIVVGKDGMVYISDTLQPRIWAAAPDLEGAMQEFVIDPLLTNPNPERALGLNGLALTPDGNFLIASIMDRMSQGGGRLVRVSLADRSVQEITLTGDVATFGGSDGMFFEPEGDLLMVNVTPPSALASASFSNDFTQAEISSRTTADDVADRPSSIAVRGDTLWIVNSQLDHVIDDGNGAMGTPPSTPFQIVGMELSQALNE
jgi:sugar lactone lactonase YvrE